MGDICTEIPLGNTCLSYLGERIRKTAVSVRLAKDINIKRTAIIDMSLTIYADEIFLQSLRVDNNFRQINMILLNNLKRMSPAKKLRILSICVVAVAVIYFVLTLISLALTGTNLMITSELATTSELQTLYSEHAKYIIFQRMIIAFDVLIILGIPLLLFSVFTFYTKGNLIIIILNALIEIMGWVSSILFISSEPSLISEWSKLWQASQYGTSGQCQIQSCGDSMINYVICGKLSLWKQTTTYLLIYIVVSVPLMISLLLLAYWTNRMDLNVVQFTEQESTNTPND